MKHITLLFLALLLSACSDKVDFRSVVIADQLCQKAGQRTIYVEEFALDQGTKVTAYCTGNMTVVGFYARNFKLPTEQKTGSPT